jgi:hypothetical protein
VRRVDRKVQSATHRPNDNAFLAVDDVAALQAAADRLSPEIIPQTARRIDLGADAPAVPRVLE